jgi:hypothetical protein
MSEAKQIVQDVLQKQGEIAGITAQTDDTIVYDKVRISKDQYAANTISAAALLDSITPYIEGYGVQIGEKSLWFWRQNRMSMLCWQNIKTILPNLPIRTPLLPLNLLNKCLKWR